MDRPWNAGRWWLPAAVCALIALGALPVSSGPTGRVTVFAAASLTEAFAAVARAFEQRNPGIRVTLNFAGSQQLAAQLEQGAGADVFASADQRWMNHVRQRGLVARAPSEFARNKVVVIAARNGPLRIARLQDLATEGVKVVLAADTVPAGRYGREALEKLGRAAGFPRDYALRVLRNVVSHEENVRGVIAKVQLGEADAGIVYRSDVTGATAARVQVIDIPDPYNVIASYPIAVLKDARNRKEADAFVALVLSPLGQRVLWDNKFVPIGGQ